MPAHSRRDTFYHRGRVQRPTGRQGLVGRENCIYSTQASRRRIRRRRFAGSVRVAPHAGYDLVVVFAVRKLSTVFDYECECMALINKMYMSAMLLPATNQTRHPFEPFFGVSAV